MDFDSHSTQTTPELMATSLYKAQSMVPGLSKSYPNELPNDQGVDFLKPETRPLHWFLVPSEALSELRNPSDASQQQSPFTLPTEWGANAKRNSDAVRTPSPNVIQHPHRSKPSTPRPPSFEFKWPPPEEQSSPQSLSSNPLPLSFSSSTSTGYSSSTENDNDDENVEENESNVPQFIRAAPGDPLHNVKSMVEKKCNTTNGKDIARSPPLSPKRAQGIYKRAHTEKRPLPPYSPPPAQFNRAMQKSHFAVPPPLLISSESFS
jgi:hypothetical protein